jgi:hypothetical protein
MKAHPKKPLLAAAFLAAIATFAGGDVGYPALAQTAAPPAAMPAGLSGTTIRALQEALNKQGIAVKTDGVLGDETRAAIKQYQSQHHLPVTGEPDKATLDKLGVAARQGAAPGGMGQGMMGPGMMGQGMMGPGMMGQGGMMSMMGQGMMGQGGMMPMMGMMCPGSAGMGPGGMGMGAMGGPSATGAPAMVERMEGRIAFVRAELKVTEAQLPAWNAFAGALQANAAKLNELAAKMRQMGGAQPTLSQRLENQEQVVAARLDGIRAVRTAFAGLLGVLTDEQKKVAEEIVPWHGGLMAMGMM